MKDQLKFESPAAEQSIEELQKRYQQLDKRKMEAEINLKNATSKLDELQQDARREYGTDDVAELRRKLNSMKTENDEKRKNYQASLDRIDADLAAVERQFAAADCEPALAGEKS